MVLEKAILSQDFYLKVELNGFSVLLLQLYLSEPLSFQDRGLGGGCGGLYEKKAFMSKFQSKLRNLNPQHTQLCDLVVM